MFVGIEKFTKGWIPTEWELLSPGFQILENMKVNEQGQLVSAVIKNYPTKENVDIDISDTVGLFMVNGEVYGGTNKGLIYKVEDSSVLRAEIASKVKRHAIVGKPLRPNTKYFYSSDSYFNYTIFSDHKGIYTVDKSKNIEGIGVLKPDISKYLFSWTAKDLGLKNQIFSSRSFRSPAWRSQTFTRPESTSVKLNATPGDSGYLGAIYPKDIRALDTNFRNFGIGVNGSVIENDHGDSFRMTIELSFLPSRNPAIGVDRNFIELRFLHAEDGIDLNSSKEDFENKSYVIYTYKVAVDDAILDFWWNSWNLYDEKRDLVLDIPRRDFQLERIPGKEFDWSNVNSFLLLVKFPKNKHTDSTGIFGANIKRVTTDDFIILKGDAGFHHITKSLTGSYSYRMVYHRKLDDYTSYSETSDESSFKVNDKVVLVREKESPSRSWVPDVDVTHVDLYRKKLNDDLTERDVLGESYHLVGTKKVTDSLIVFVDNMLDNVAVSQPTLNLYNIRAPSEVRDIVGNFFGRTVYMTQDKIYLSQIEDPGLVDSRNIYDVSSRDREINYWITKVGAAALLVGTSEDIYEITGTGVITGEYNTDLTIRPLGVDQPPISSIKLVYQDSVIYMAKSSIRAYNKSRSVFLSKDLDYLFRDHGDLNTWDCTGIERVKNEIFFCFKKYICVYQPEIDSWYKITTKGKYIKGDFYSTGSKNYSIHETLRYADQEYLNLKCRSHRFAGNNLLDRYHIEVPHILGNIAGPRTNLKIYNEDNDIMVWQDFPFLFSNIWPKEASSTDRYGSSFYFTVDSATYTIFNVSALGLKVTPVRPDHESFVTEPITLDTSEFKHIHHIPITLDLGKGIVTIAEKGSSTLTWSFVGDNSGPKIYQLDFPQNDNRRQSVTFVIRTDKTNALITTEEQRKSRFVFHSIGRPVLRAPLEPVTVKEYQTGWLNFGTNALKHVDYMTFRIGPDANDVTVKVWLDDDPGYPTSIVSSAKQEVGRVPIGKPFRLAKLSFNSTGSGFKLYGNNGDITPVYSRDFQSTRHLIFTTPTTNFGTPIPKKVDSVNITIHVVNEIINAYLIIDGVKKTTLIALAKTKGIVNVNIPVNESLTDLAIEFRSRDISSAGEGFYLYGNITPFYGKELDRPLIKEFDTGELNFNNSSAKDFHYITYRLDIPSGTVSAKIYVDGTLNKTVVLASSTGIKTYSIILNEIGTDIRAVFTASATFRYYGEPTPVYRSSLPNAIQRKYYEITYPDPDRRLISNFLILIQGNFKYTIKSDGVSYGTGTIDTEGRISKVTLPMTKFSFYKDTYTIVLESANTNVFFKYYQMFDPIIESPEIVNYTTKVHLSEIYDYGSEAQKKIDFIKVRMNTYEKRIIFRPYIDGVAGRRQWINTGDIGSSLFTEIKLDLSKDKAGTRFQYLFQGQQPFLLKQIEDPVFVYKDPVWQTNYLIQASNFGYPFPKEFDTISLEIDTGAVDSTVEIMTILGGAESFSTHTINTNKHETVVIPINRTGTSLGIEIKGNFSLKSIGDPIFSTVDKPERRSYLVTPSTNYGTANKKHIDSVPAVLRTFGTNVVVYMRADGVRTKIATLNSTAIKTFSLPVNTSAVDFAFDFRSSKNFEFYALLDPIYAKELDIPVLRKNYTIGPSNFGIPTLKKIDSIPIIIHTFSEDVQVTPTIDGTTYSTLNISSSDVKTVSIPFDGGVYGIDFSFKLVGTEEFEFHALLDPVILETFEMPKTKDLVGPLVAKDNMWFRKFFITVWPLSNNVKWSLSVDGEDDVDSGTIITEMNKLKTYEIDFIKGIKGQVAYLHFSSTAKFYRSDVDLRVSEGGRSNNFKVIRPRRTQ